MTDTGDMPQFREEVQHPSECGQDAMSYETLAVWLDSYFVYAGDADAMVEWLIQTQFADVVERTRGAPPLVVDGEMYPLMQVVRELLRWRAHEIVALIEGHNETRH